MGTTVLWGSVVATEGFASNIAAGGDMLMAILLVRGLFESARLATGYIGWGMILSLALSQFKFWPYNLRTNSSF